MKLYNKVNPVNKVGPGQSKKSKVELIAPEAVAAAAAAVKGEVEEAFDFQVHGAKMVNAIVVAVDQLGDVTQHLDEVETFEVIEWLDKLIELPVKFQALVRALETEIKKRDEAYEGAKPSEPVEPSEPATEDAEG